MRWEADNFLKWTEMPWWLRWIVCLIPIGVGIAGLAAGRIWLWVWAIAGLLCLINLFLTWRDVLDYLQHRGK